ncbi:hypothetical protein MKX01_019294 [Papaver californicum]|nr:hypothetical protein MKX01_019294 [Papaver californicum]
MGDHKNVDFKGKVCVTGASGYLASSSDCCYLGNHGKVAHLWRLEGAKERLKLVKADLMTENSFDVAISGCDGVFHTASHVLGPKADPKTEILDPAIQGTLNVLKSCKKNPSLKRVVLTSSSSTVRVRDDFDPLIPLDESSWTSEELCRSLQIKLYIWYPLSKTLAEKEAWEYCKENGISLATILLSFVIGPSLPREICSTLSDAIGLLKALCHILAYENADTNGRYTCSFKVTDKKLASFLSNRYPTLAVPKRFEKLDRPSYEFNTSKMRSLGIKFKGLEEMFDDCIASLKEQCRLDHV